MSNKSTIIQLDGIKIDLFEYINKNSDFLKKQYLEIVLNIGNLTINNQTLRNLSEYNGHSLWEMSLINEKNIYKSNYVFKTIKYLALKKIIHESLKKNIKIFFLERELKNILKKEFYFKKIIFIKLDSSFKKYFKNILLKSKIFNYFYFLYYFIKNCSFSKKKEYFFKKKKFLIFSYFTHYDLNKFSNKVFYPKQWTNLWEKIDKNLNFIQLFLPNKNFKFFIQIKNYLSKIKIKNLEDKNFINNNIFFEDYKYVRKDLKKTKIKTIYPKIEKLLKKDKNYKYFFSINEELFISSFSGYVLMQNLLWIRVFDNFLSRIPKHDYGIFLYENQPWEKALITSWKKFKHGQIIGYSHTTINYWHLNYFNDPKYNSSKDFEKYSPNFIAVSSEISKKFLINQIICPKKIVEVEALRYLWILDRNTKFEEKENKEILFLGDYKKSTNKKLIDILNQSKTNFTNLGYNLTFKPHPANLVKNINNSIQETTDDLEYLVDRFDYVISSNTTSAIIEVLSCGKRTFLFKDKNDFDLSPIKNTILEEKINFFYSKKDLLDQISTFKDKIEPINYYYLNKNISKWKKILEIKN